MRCVVEDVKVGVAITKFADRVYESLERGFLFVFVVRPDSLVALSCPPAPKVLEPDLADIWIALKIEEHVAKGRGWQGRVSGGARWRELATSRLTTLARSDLKRRVRSVLKRSAASPPGAGSEGAFAS